MALMRLIRRHVVGNASFWGLIEYGSGPLVALAALPVLLRQLDTTGFGQYAMILAVAGFGNLANLGAAVTATKLVAEKAHEPGGAYRGAGVASALIFCALGAVALVTLVVTAMLAGIWPDAHFGNAPLYTLLPAALAVYLAQQTDQLYAGALKGRERFPAIALSECGGRLGAMALACLAAWLTHSALWTAAAQGTGLLLSAGVKMLVFARGEHHYWVKPIPDRAAMAAAFQFSRWSWLHGVSTLAFGSLDRVVVGSLMGPTALALYAVGVQVGQITHTASVAVFQKAMPRVNRLRVSPPYPGAAGEEIRRLTRWNLVLSAGATLLLLALSQPLLALMLGAANAAGHQLTFDLLILASGVLSMNAAAHFSLLGLGNGRAVALLNGLGGVAMLVLMVVLAGPAGQNAAAIGRMAYAAVTLAAIGLALRESREPLPPTASIATR
ncbi:polysaccharide biosynthesis family protein [Pigmentiphaga sp. NML080357]|uniref:lipopolysaccharide biosynthesis protein n=1 Tax=Pigmentiphaga sp. NML080357 TaxID=2008675 RepID=UPI000B409B21|nr:lipopolysaccharide biosynthesis protein [Pigmentiphaga sp. NML080357]OVZ58491.1 polysaccharide biosynthesis family protein [Pigmentiphaga sp. NML080357]